MSDPCMTPERVDRFNAEIRSFWHPDLTWKQCQSVAHAMEDTLWRMGFQGDHDDQVELARSVGTLVGSAMNMAEFENGFWEVVQNFCLE